MSNEQQLRTIAQHVHCAREALRQEQIRLLAQLRTTEVQMEKAARFFTEHPELDTEAPARWEDLTNYEQVITHFLAKRGHAKRIPPVLALFRAETGATCVESAFRMSLSRLRAKKVIDRTSMGWAVTSRMLALAPTGTPVTYELFPTSVGTSRRRRAGGSSASDMRRFTAFVRRRPRGPAGQPRKGPGLAGRP